MKRHQTMTLDGNEAVAKIAYSLSELIVIYPITPASPMGEWSDAWAAQNKPNLWGSVPSVVEMQSEAGAAGTLHGALQAGSLATTFTASQGLLLMIPNMYKIAGELTGATLHVAARSLAAQGLSIFGDHSDVMATRGTGWALLCSASVQEAHDFAAISHIAALKSRVPFLHFFDGFRTSHEIQKIVPVDEDHLRAMIPEAAILEHRDRALTPDRPVMRGTAQNPDVYFQGRESVNPFYLACSEIVKSVMAEFGNLTGRVYQPFEYVGDPEAESVVILMGSGCETVEETVQALNQQGQKWGVLKVRLYRPWSAADFFTVLPTSTKRIAVLDRTKEPGALGEPLYLDVVATVQQSAQHQAVKTMIGGRYGLSSKEFTPAMVKAVFENLQSPEPKNGFTVGIVDDVSFTSLDFDPNFALPGDRTFAAIFYGLGADGTVGANKNTIEIIGDSTDQYAQGYFVYDSKKSGAMTVSHLRFGADPIRAPYLIEGANFIGCHQWMFLERYEILDKALDGATVLINAAYPAEELWDHLPLEAQEIIIRKQLKLWAIDAYKVARESGTGGHINIPMQVCFFTLTGVLPQEEALNQIRAAIQKTYGKKGSAVVNMNLRAVDNTLSNLQEVPIRSAQSTLHRLPMVSDRAPDFVRNVQGAMMAREGDRLPVSALPCDGTYPTGTSQWEKRNIAQQLPEWDPAVCVQCGKCIAICPHATIRGKSYDPSALGDAPAGFRVADTRDPDFKGEKFTIQVAPEDCTGCGLCVEICPAKDRKRPSRKALNWVNPNEVRDAERTNWDFFLGLPNPDRAKLHPDRLRQQQWQEPLFEFSGACAGCGETPYLKLVSQLFGDRALIANATGCSSIYGGNLPTTPWTKNADGRGPAWANSLFEDNAEFGLGFRLSVNQQATFAGELLKRLAGELGDSTVQDLLQAEQRTEAEIWEQRDRVASLKTRLPEINHPDARRLLAVADYLVKKSVWIVGGDGWAYDIGFGGLDHVLASGQNVNVLVLDTEVYSNTGGQASKSTPRGAVAKFAAGGKPAAKKDLGAIAMTYGNIYVASVAMGARDEHTLRAFLEAEAYDGPSLILAYSHCIAHGIDMSKGTTHQKAAVDSGRWFLYRYNPDLVAQGKNPLHLDSPTPKMPVAAAMDMETRFKMLSKTNPAAAQQLAQQAQADINHRWRFYQYLAAQSIGQPQAADRPSPTPPGEAASSSEPKPVS
ncbi:pyruvate:ferredoxin (flavodoxin) oxidoreductase [Limnothrix redekei]|uniref:Pyruvate-flavodoxin oxidoreductase n=1 Tax=Limnothrix redekei LRLZ20PSL1 TaxID=3112953 RepID=A0ABW7C5J6_9CYAN